jgi:hypothetical protein
MKLHHALGQRSGFIGTEDVHTAEVFNGGEPLDERPARVEDIDVAIAYAGNVVCLAASCRA